MQKRLSILLFFFLWYGGGGHGLLSMASEVVDPFALLFQMPTRYQDIDNYTSTFLIQERVDSKLQPESLITLKFKKPFMVYLKWIGGPKKGREVLYVTGQNDNELLVRTNKWYDVFVGSLDPHSALAMDGNRHPITEIGLGHLIEMLVTNFRSAKDKGEVQIQPVTSEAIFDRPAYKIEAAFPFSKYYKDASRITLYIDKEHQLPIYITIFDEANQLVERYGYKDLRLNIGLTEKDFAKEAYNF
jgi:hypothetical protein